MSERNIIEIAKLDAAKRQINMAIKLMFQDGDPVCIHTLAAAGNRVIQDICEARGDVEEYNKVDSMWNSPAEKKEYLRYQNTAANFFKHAEKDPEPESTIQLNMEITDLLIFGASFWCRGLNGGMTSEMKLFGGIMLTRKADRLPKEMRDKMIRDFPAYPKMVKVFEGLSRAEAIYVASDLFRQMESKERDA